MKHDDIADLLTEAAARFIVPRFKALQDHEISSKTSPTDLVTQADLDAEEFLEAELLARYPGSLVLGEEAVSKGASSLDVLQKDMGADQIIWVIDPVDGTHNFVHGKDEFGVMLACIVGGVVRHSWIYDVPAQRMAIAEIGQGASIGDITPRVSQKTDVGDMIAHISTKFFPKPLRSHVDDKASNFKQSEPLRCAAHEYMRVATGVSDAALYCRLKPWDHLPGALLVQESGGYVRKWDQQPYTPRDDYAGLIVANSEVAWNEICNLFFEGIDVGSYLK